MQLPDSVQNILSYGKGYKDGMNDGHICGFHDALVCAVNDLTGLLKKYHDMEKEYAGLQAKAYRERMENKPQLESATENHAIWIPVEDALPEKQGRCLVTLESGQIEIRTFLFSLTQGAAPYFSGCEKVIAWIPMPDAYEPPKGGESDA